MLLLSLLADDLMSSSREQINNGCCIHDWIQSMIIFSSVRTWEFPPRGLTWHVTPTDEDEPFFQNACGCAVSRGAEQCEKATC